MPLATSPKIIRFLGTGSGRSSRNFGKSSSVNEASTIDGVAGVTGVTGVMVGDGVAYAARLSPFDWTLICRKPCKDVGRDVNFFSISCSSIRWIFVSDASCLFPLVSVLFVRFGDDTKKFFGGITGCGCLNAWSPPFTSDRSNSELWLGGRGAIRFLRLGAMGGWCRLFNPVESIELSELVELYGDVVLVYCRLEFLLNSDDDNDSRLFWRSLTISSVWNFGYGSWWLSVFSARRISFSPTSPIVKSLLYTCDESPTDKSG